MIFAETFLPILCEVTVGKIIQPPEANGAGDFLFRLVLREIAQVEFGGVENLLAAGW